MASARPPRVPLLTLLMRRYPEEEKKTLHAWVLCGEIRVNGNGVKDPKQVVSEDSILEHRGGGYVSRGGDKIASVFPYLLERYPLLDPAGAYVLDAGSSTGGFSDFLLQAGASRVYCLDVGYNQLDYRLRTDPRVTVLERCNVLDVEELIRQGRIDPAPWFCTADLSFRSIQGAATALLTSSTKGLLLALIKPQFERRYASKHRGGTGSGWSDDFEGIVSEEEIPEILEDVRSRLSREGVRILEVLPSGVPGAKGNQEYFFLMTMKSGN